MAKHTQIHVIDKYHFHSQRFTTQKLCSTIMSIFAITGVNNSLELNVRYYTVHNEVYIVLYIWHNHTKTIAGGNVPYFYNVTILPFLIISMKLKKHTHTFERDIQCS